MIYLSPKNIYIAFNAYIRIFLDTTQLIKSYESHDRSNKNAPWIIIITIIICTITLVEQTSGNLIFCLFVPT